MKSVVRLMGVIVLLCTILMVASCGGSKPNNFTVRMSISGANEKLVVIKNGQTALDAARLAYNFSNDNRGTLIENQAGPWSYMVGNLSEKPEFYYPNDPMANFVIAKDCRIDLRPIVVRK